MGYWRPQSARALAEFSGRICRAWDAATEAERAERHMINPDEPVVLRVPNPEWSGPGEAGPYGEDDEGEPTHICFHVECIGGGGDVDDGEECGHEGAQITGQEIDGREFLCNGRRLSGTAT